MAFFDSMVRNTLGRQNAKAAASHPIASTVISMGALALTRRFLPARVAMIGGTLLAGYVTKKWADYEADRKAGGEAYADAKAAVEAGQPENAVPIGKAGL